MQKHEAEEFLRDVISSLRTVREICTRDDVFVLGIPREEDGIGLFDIETIVDALGIEPKVEKFEFAYSGEQEILSFHFDGVLFRGYRDVKEKEDGI